MKFLESDLEEIIMKSSCKKLSDRGLYLSDLKRRQVRIGNYGIADIVCYDKGYREWSERGLIIHEKPAITVCELKKDKVSLSAFAQGCNYVKGIQDYFTQKGRDIREYNWRLILIGKEVDENSSLIYMPDLFMDMNNQSTALELSIFKYQYDLEGLMFIDVYGYSLIENGFKI